MVLYVCVIAFLKIESKTDKVKILHHKGMCFLMVVGYLRALG